MVIYRESRGKILNNPTGLEFFQERTGRFPINQLNSLRIIARYGKQTKYALHKILIKNIPEINDAVKELERKGLIKAFVSGDSLSRIFYTLTFDGMKIVINDDFTKEPKSKIKINVKTEPIEKTWHKLTSQEFWKCLYDSYDDSSITSVNHIRRICSFYENVVLNISKEFVMPNFFQDYVDGFFREMDVHSDYEDFSQEVQNKKLIIMNIGFGKPMTKNNIIKIKGLTKSKTILSQMVSKEQLVNSLIKDGYLVKSKHNGVEKYDLSVLGLIRLLNYLYLEFGDKLFVKGVITDDNHSGVEKSKDVNAKLFVKQFNKIKKKYSNLLPDIFDNENYCKLGISSFEVLSLLMHSSGYEPFFGKVGDEDEAELLDSIGKFSKIRQKNHHNKLLSHVLEGFDIYEELIKNKKFKNAVLHQYLNDLIFVSDKELLDVLFKGNPSLQQYFVDVSRWSKIIQDKITFDFYSVLRAYHDGWETVKDLAQSNIRKSHDRDVSQLSSFIVDYATNIDNNLVLV